MKKKKSFPRLWTREKGLSSGGVGEGRKEGRRGGWGGKKEEGKERGGGKKGEGEKGGGVKRRKRGRGGGTRRWGESYRVEGPSGQTVGPVWSRELS